MPDQNIRLFEHNAIVASTVINVATLVLGELMGKEVQRNLDGATLTDEAISGLVAARIKNKLAI